MELVVVILIIAILAVAVFSGGSSVIKKANIARVKSDLYNFTIPVEQFLCSTPSVANDTTTANFSTPSSKYVQALNKILPADYQLSSISASDLNGNVTANVASTSVAFKSKKTDAWGTPYFVVFDYEDRHSDHSSDFYITVVSAGPDSQIEIGGTIGDDDIFTLCQFSNGEVTSKTYNAATDSFSSVGVTESGTAEVISVSGGTYSGNWTYRPVTEHSNKPVISEDNGSYSPSGSGDTPDTGLAEGVTQVNYVKNKGIASVEISGVTLLSTDSITITFKLNSLPPAGSSGAPILYCGSWGNMPYVAPDGKLVCNLYDDNGTPIILTPGTEYSLLINSIMLSCGGKYTRNDNTFVSDALYLFGYGANYADISIKSVVIEHASGIKTTLIAATDKDGKPCIYNKSTGVASYPSPRDNLETSEE